MSVSYILKRSKRRRSISIKVESYTAKVIVSAPMGTPLEKINRLVLEKQDWITRHVELMKSKNAILPKLATGEKIYIAGKYYTLNICDCKRLSLSGSTINLPSDNYKKALISFTKKTFLLYATQKTAMLAKEYGFKYGSISVGSAKNTWGTCSQAKNIIYTFALAFVPEHLCSYVILHELCHTKEMNHGKPFYKILSAVMPNHKALDKELRRYASYLRFLREDT